MYILYKEDTDYLNKLLNLPARGSEQDWDIELADPARLSEFLATYRAYDLTLSVKKAFLALIIASYDVLLEYDPDDDDFYWTSIKKIMNPEKSGHLALLEYWALEGADEDDVFPVTPAYKSLFRRDLTANLEPVY